MSALIGSTEKLISRREAVEYSGEKGRWSSAKAALPPKGAFGGVRRFALPEINRRNFGWTGRIVYHCSLQHYLHIHVFPVFWS
jgi:hypothetical protein